MSLALEVEGRWYRIGRRQLRKAHARMAYSDSMCRWCQGVLVYRQVCLLDWQGGCRYEGRVVNRMDN